MPKKTNKLSTIEPPIDSQSANENSSTQPQNKVDFAHRRFGKDEMNLADWSISVSQYEQPRMMDGGKVEYVEHVLDRPDGTKQIVTIQSPTRIGLPTPTETDVLVGLFYLASQQNFESDKVHFVPAELLNILRWGDSKPAYDRLETALLRLRAATVSFELTWYSKQNAKVEPVSITGILAEAKLVKRRGPAPKKPDSYIQWTDHFYTSIRDGNLTDLDLDLYFSLKRPGAKQLFRHLNKVWHAGKKPKEYGRDLRQLACGHLGMTDNKDLKRNFDRCVQELEKVGYLRRETTRYSKVKKGVWRASFKIGEEYIRTRGAKTPKRRVKPTNNPADRIVDQYNQHRHGESRCIKKHERDRASELLASHDEKLLDQYLPKAASETEKTFRGKDAHFGAAFDIIERLIAEHHSRQQQEAKRQIKRAEDAKKMAAEKLVKAAEKKKYAELRTLYSELPASEQEALWNQVISTANGDFLRGRYQKQMKEKFNSPPHALLDLLSHKSK